MTPPPPPTPVWWAKPSWVLPVIGTIVVLVALLTPQPSEGRLGDQRLSISLSGPSNARVLAELSKRMGWTVVNDTTPDIVAGSGKSIHAVLAPPIPTTASEAHTYLDAVRGGDALLLVLNARDALSDSLGVAHSPGGRMPPSVADTSGCERTVDFAPPRWSDGRMNLYSLRWLRGKPADAIQFGTLVLDRNDSLPHAATPSLPAETAAGFSFGKGRVLVVSDPDLLRNDVIRRCQWAADVVNVRMLEWLRAGGSVPRTTIVFDEYHQGFGRRAGLSDVVFPFLFEHPVGRAVMAVVLAGLILLWALGPRPIVPPEDERIERRDPLEQVDALSHAYEQVRATRTIVARLVRGVRWRVQRAWPSLRASTDADFLGDAARRYPALAGDVAVIRRALDAPVNEKDLREIGAALHRVEDTLTKTIS